MHEFDLQLSQWQQLSEADRRANFGQVLRYFVSPLVAVDWIEPVKVDYQQTVLKTYSVWLLGEQFLFIPGQPAVQLGWSAGATKLTPNEWFAQSNRPLKADEGIVLTNQEAVSDYVNELTSDNRTVNMPALLVAQAAQPIDWLAQGVYTLVNGQFSGNQLFYRQYQAELQNLLYRQRESQSAYFESRHLIVKPLMQHQAYQVFEKISLSELALKQTLHQQGFDFVSPDQYEWLKGAGTTSLWVAGNHLPTANQLMHQSFGLDFDGQRRYELTNDPLVYKGGPCVTGGRYQLEQVLPTSPFYESGLATQVIEDVQVPRQYRRTIPIVLE